MLTSPPVVVSLPRHCRFSVHLVVRQLPSHQMVPADGDIFGHNFLSTSDRTEVGPSCSDRNEFVLRSNVVVRCRVYAVTGKNKLLCSPLALLIVVQILSEPVTTIYYLRRPGGFLNACSFAPVDEHLDQVLPEKILRLFRLCTHERWKPGALVFVNVAFAFGGFFPHNVYSWSSRSTPPTPRYYRYLRLFNHRLQSQESVAG